MFVGESQVSNRFTGMQVPVKWSAFVVVQGGGRGLETPELDLDEEIGQETPWNVVVHNDPVNLMSYVTKVFQKVLGFSREKAEKHMMEVHQKGRSVVWSGARERAELYVQQLQACLLLTTLERSL